MTFYKDPSPLLLSVIGYKDSGKTYAAELIIQSLKKHNLKIATIKHTHNTHVPLDKEGTDSWRFRQSGSDIIALAASKELALLLNDEINYETIFKHINLEKCDVIVIEGFKKTILPNPTIVKILCIKNVDELKDFKDTVKGKILAICSLKKLDYKTLILRHEDHLLNQIVSSYLKDWIKSKKLLVQLPGLDCTKCGYSTCSELAEAIVKGEKTLEECKVLKSTSFIDIQIQIKDKDIPLQPFVAKIIRSTIIGMLSSLKGIHIKGDEKFKLEIST